MASIKQTQVLIVGAGPTGLMAANQLQRFGIDFIIVDPKVGPTKESRAILVTSRSLEIYQQMGLSDFIVDNGMPILSTNVFSKGKKKTEVKLGILGQGKSEFSYLLAFEQFKNEALLTSNLLKNGKEVHWQHEFISLEDKGNFVESTIKHSQETYLIRSDYVIAADGAKSVIRHQLNFSFKGGTYENKFFVLDAKIKWDLEYDKLMLAPGKKNFCAFLPLTTGQSYRIIGTLPAEYSEKESISFDEVKPYITENVGMQLEFENINWFTIYKIHHRGVEEFSKGRVFLAGDSAHIHSPAGGQGMNTGLQDAYNIAWKLAFVLKKYADPKLLNTYNEERLPFAKFLLRFTDRAFSMITNTNPVIRFFRSYVFLNLVNFFTARKVVKDRIFKTISQTGFSYNFSSLSKNLTIQKLKFQAGNRLPYIETNKGETKFYELFTEPCFHLLCLYNTELNDHSKQIQAFFNFPVKQINYKINEIWRSLGVKEDLFVLVRPDNYISIIFDEFDEEKLRPISEKL